MKKEITSDWIDRFNEDDLDEQEKALFRERIHASPLLRAEVEVDAGLNRLLADHELLDFMQKLNKVASKNERGHGHTGLLMIAATLLSFLLTGGVCYLVRTHSGPPGHATGRLAIRHQQKSAGSTREQDHHADSPDQGCTFPEKVPGIIYRGLMARNYEPMPELEMLAGEVTRSGMFKLISPPLDIAIPAQTEVPFAWRTDGNGGSLELVLLDNHGVPVLGVPLGGRRSYILTTNELPGGLYYWKFIMGDGMVLMGRLTIY